MKAGQWRWAIGYPKGGQACLSNTGWLDTAAEAAQHVEETWDRQKATINIRLDGKKR